jgi:hypothetical protein
MRRVIILLAAAMLLFSATVEVKRSSVDVTLNSKEQTLNKDSSISLEPGDTICLKSDNKGKLVIDNKIQITKRSKNRCYSVPKEEGFTLATIEEKVKIWSDPGESVSVGATRSIEDNEVQLIFIPKNKDIDNIAIFTNDYTPKADHVFHVNSKKEYKPDSNGLIYIPVNSIKQDDRIEVYYMFFGEKQKAKTYEISFVDLCNECSEKELIDALLKEKNILFKAVMYGFSQ